MGAPIFASATESERVDISAGDQVPTINNKVGLVLNCDAAAAGSTLKIDTGVQDGYTTIALREGINFYVVTKIYKVGSTIAGGNIEIQAW